jgi:hemerythrin
MARFTWDPTYSVSVRHFDEQHKGLFSILNELYDAMKAGAGQKVLRDVLVNLLDYTLLHFAGEEAVMRNAGYPRLQSHIEQHRRFTDKIDEACAKYNAGSVGLSVGVLDFLTEWLQNHILHTDKQYGEFLNSKGIE